MATDAGSEEFFHVDRDTRLHPGFEFPRRAWPGEFSPQTTACFESRYPGGLSEWGASYLLDAGDEKLILTEDLAQQLQLAAGEETEKAIRRSRQRIAEVIWEFARLEFARDKPSRLQAVFAYDDLDVARDFRTDRCGDERAPIWRVQAEDAFQCDASWLQLAVNIPELIVAATSYWAGRRFPQASLPMDIEYLLSGRVVVLDRAA